jgi:hypothetical protein
VVRRTRIVKRCGTPEKLAAPLPHRTRFEVGKMVGAAGFEPTTLSPPDWILAVTVDNEG